MAPNRETFYRDHWVDIEPDRFDRYLHMFQITDANRAIYFEPLGAQRGETIVDFGCGPGDVSLELAKHTGGVVHGLDINADLLEVARSRAEVAGLSDRAIFHHVTDQMFPLADGSVDRVIFKSVLLYVVGRHLRGHLLDAGFQDVKTMVSAFVDDAGFFRNTLENFLNFARALQTHPPQEIDAMSARAAECIDAGRWLYVQNFFQANGTR